MSYRLDQLLTEYGEPDEVLLHTSLSLPLPDPPFSVVLIYSQQGIVAFYEYVGKEVGDEIWACPSPVGPELQLWVPEHDLSAAAVELFVLGPDPGVFKLRSLQDTTGMTVGTFYQSYKETDNKTCIVTPSAIWP
jgi:hypothetical protein